jgi:chitinase
MQDKIVLAYVTSNSTIMPDPAVLTHINYAFGTVNKTFDGVIIHHEERLTSIAALKAGTPSLRVLLSIGGWTAGGFSEMASTDTGRKAFAAHCASICTGFGLDGIDIDWEYPTSEAAGISASPADTANYTLLMQEIRAAIGNNRLLTLASHAGAKFIDFAAIRDTIDFVNIMVYDVDRPPYHHSALFASPMARKWTCESAVNAHISAGLPPEKLVLGLPFYGHGDTKAVPDFIDYGKIIRLTGFEKKWDEAAQVPYLQDSKGRVVCVYDDEQSLALKCAYIKSRGGRGAMYWEYNGDDTDGTLRKCVYHAIMKD